MARFAWELRQLRTRAGAPSYRELARRAHYSASTLAEATKGSRLPTLDVAVALAEACGGDREEWAARWRAAARGRTGTRAATQAATQPATRSGRGAPGPDRPVARRECPYPGPRPFTARDAPGFFGREEPVRRLIDLVTGDETPGPVVLSGPSGSGRTSLLHAGLLPALGPDWLHLALTPSRDPLGALAGAVEDLTGGGGPPTPREAFTDDPKALYLALSGLLLCRPPGTRVLVTVDRFEEAVLAGNVPAAERDAFLAQLAHTARAGDDRLRVVVALRSDARTPAAWGETARVDLAPLRADDLRRAVVGPAEAAGLTVEAALVDALLADLDGQPGAPALLSDALRRAWERRTDGVLRLAGHLAEGGVGAAVARTAEREYAARRPDERRLLRALFVRLTALGDGTDDTPRRVDREELRGLAPRGNLDRLLGELAGARLVVLDAGTVEPAHAAVVTAWPRLRHWLAHDRDGLRTHRRLTEAAGEWSAAGRHPGALYRGVRLAAARSWAREHPAELNARERAFLTASRTAERRRRWAVRLLIATVSALALLAGVMALRAVLDDRAAPTDRRATGASPTTATTATSSTAAVAGTPTRAATTATSPSAATAGTPLTAATPGTPPAEGPQRATGGRSADCPALARASGPPGRRPGPDNPADRTRQPI
ncbi:helix-turn-helix domain-containing protein [Streptomyces sp. bgisy153]|uniref:nSTAND1 domain-containing NTPase n=1 Tax=Streptomyces sp. bgisy153 TaxID=3413793 RepID=UPI003D743D78